MSGIPAVKLNAQLSDKMDLFVNNINKQKSLACDAKCMRNKELQKLYIKYSAAKQNIRTAPQQLRTAEKAYYLEDKGWSGYNNFITQKESENAEQNVSRLQGNLNTYYQNIERNINYYDSQQIYRRRMTTLLDDYDEKLKTTKQEVKRLDSKANVAKRLSKYYEKDLEWGAGALYYLKNIYWCLAIVILFYCSWGIYKKKYSSKVKKEIMVTISCLLFVPLLIQPFYRMVIKK